MKILLIDDDDGLLDNFSLIISYKRPGTKITTASNGREALTLVENQEFDLIISDIRMPLLDGFQLKKELNNRKINTPLVFMTGLKLVDGTLIGRQLGAIGFLSKPLTGNELAAAIDRAADYNQRIRPKQEYLKPIAEAAIKVDNLPTVIKELSGDYTIGRSPDADIRLSSNKASREHALLNRTAESLAQSNCRSHYRLIDYSRNGLEVNGQKIEAYAMLHHGDILSFPGCTIRYSVLGDFIDPKGTSS